MAIADIHQRVRQIWLGQGLGEKPSLRRAAADANETVSGSIVTFTMLAGEGDKIKAGNVLSVLTTTAASMHVVYVLSVSTDTLTCVNGYLGSPLVADTLLDGAILEQNPVSTAYEIDGGIDTVVGRFLWPFVYDIVTATIASPNLVNGQEAVPAEVEEIISAWQTFGSDILGVPVTPKIPYELHTDLATNGKLAVFDWDTGSAGYYTYRAKFTEADEADTELTHLIALGTAALLLGTTMVETTVESTKKDNVQAVGQRAQAGGIIWRDFLTLRQAMSEEQSKRLPQRIYIDRG